MSSLKDFDAGKRPDAQKFKRPVYVTPAYGQVMEARPDFRKSPFSYLQYNFRFIYPDSYPAKFNAECAQDMILLYSKPGDRVFDPFCGSGEIPLAAGLLGRHAVGFDINQKAIEISVAKADDHSAIIAASGGSADFKVADVRQIPLEDNSQHLCVTSPPFGTCYDKETEILTEQGWVPFPDLVMSDKVAIYDQGRMLFEYPSNIQRQPYHGPMIRLHSKIIDLLVTPNHRIYAKRYIGHGQYEDWQFYEANKLLHSRSDYYFKRIADWEGNEEEYIKIPLSHGSSRSSQILIYKVRMDDWLEFFGYWLAEGYSRSYQAIITQSKSHKYNLQKMMDCSKRIFEPLDIHIHYYNTSSNGINITICNKGLATYLPNPKRIPNQIQRLSKRQLQILWHATCLGDGDQEDRRIFIGNKELADDLNEIALRLGYSSNIITRENRADLIVSYGQNKNHKYSCARNTPTLIDYHGHVYCCSVRTGIIMVRRNRKTVWCGNSIDAKHIKYSDAEGCLGNSKDYHDFLPELRASIKEIYRVLHKNGVAVIEMRDRGKGMFIPLGAITMMQMIQEGFEPWAMFVLPWYPYSMWPYGPKDARKAIPSHAYLCVGRKTGKQGVKEMFTL